MKKIILAYFPIIYTMLQLICNVVYFIDKEFYLNLAFYFQNTIGTSLILSVFLVIYTSYFKFCSISKITALTQLLMSIVYLVIQDDSIYNIIFQITVMFISLILTLYLYIKKFPKCNISLNILFSFLLMKNSFNCFKALNEFKTISYQQGVEEYNKYKKN